MYNPKLCIISAYIPSKGSKSYNEEYIETLDELREIIVKYNKDHCIVLCGDMNASLHSNTADDRDRLCWKFCIEMDLQLKEDYPIGKTYIHVNGKKSSQIDYILINTSFKSHISNIKIRNDLTNTSDHRTVTADIILEQNTSAEGKSNTVSSENRCVLNVKWDKVNIVEYKEFIEENLDIPTTVDTNYELIEANQHLSHKAVECCSEQPEKQKK